MNVDCYFIVYFSLNSFYLHFSAIWNMLKCNFVFRNMCLSTFSHDAVQILASPESIAGGAPNSKQENWGNFLSNLLCVILQISLVGEDNLPDFRMQMLAALHVFKCNRFRTPCRSHQNVIAFGNIYPDICSISVYKHNPQPTKTWTK